MGASCMTKLSFCFSSIRVVILKIDADVPILQAFDQGVDSLLPERRLSKGCLDKIVLEPTCQTMCCKMFSSMELRW